MTFIAILSLFCVFFTPILIYTLYFHKTVILSHNNENLFDSERDKLECHVKY
jgi:hypothetical protein